MTRRNDDLIWRSIASRSPTWGNAAYHAVPQKSKPDSTGAKPNGAAPYVPYPVKVIYQMGELSIPARRNYIPLLLHLSWKAGHRPFKLPNRDLNG